MADKSRHVLDGYKVLDFTQFLAGPTVTRMMAEMGADVIKVEIAPIGDFSRGLPYLHDGRSAYYIQQNRGKKSLCLDLKNPAAAAIIRDLIPKMDIVVENYAPGVIARLGFGYEAVRALNPNIIMCSISTFGQSGPLANRPGYDFIGCAYSGVLSMIGERDGAPSLPAVGLGDITTGVHALSAIVTALLHRERTGEGQYVETSLLDCYFSYHDLPVHTVSLTDGTISPRRNGAHHYAMAPLGIFKGKHHPILIMAGTEHQFPYLCRAIGRPRQPTRAATTPRGWRIWRNEATHQAWFDAAPSDDEYTAFSRSIGAYAGAISRRNVAHPPARAKSCAR